MADTPAKRIRGLSGRESFGKDDAMLFVFNESRRYTFWMQGMRFSIDMVWLDEKRKVVHIAENAKPCRFIIDCRPYAPKRPAKYVVEFHAGTARRMGLKAGESLSI